jgi:hypothetical protein
VPGMGSGAGPCEGSSAGYLDSVNEKTDIRWRAGTTDRINRQKRHSEGLRGCEEWSMAIKKAVRCVLRLIEHASNLQRNSEEKCW